MKEKVVIGMSGGVDSSVAAYLLKEQGYEVTGVMMQLTSDELFKENDKGCCFLSASNDARMVADILDIPFYMMNLKTAFRRNVIDYFIDEYMQGRTPNPCVICNKTIKFEEFLKKTQELGADYIATGHYAQIIKDGDRFLLKRGKDPKKDQTYMLYNLTQYQLQHTLMPCGDYYKTDIRKIADKIGLPVSQKKDSQEICFVPDNNHGNFIKQNARKKIKKGNFIDKKGNILGKHEGIVYYTIGQRKGLGLALGKPVYVIDINPLTHEVLIGDEEDIFKTELIVKNLNFIMLDKLRESMKVQAKIRYSAKLSNAEIIPLEDGRIKVIFEEKQRAISKGQSAVFYKGDFVVGGGVIDEVI